MRSYAAAERALVAWIEEELPATDRASLTAGYLGCRACAPTRPHPRGPRTGAGYRMAFAVHRFCDRLMDTLDSRPGLARGLARGGAGAGAHPLS